MQDTDHQEPSKDQVQFHDEAKPACEEKLSFKFGKNLGSDAVGRFAIGAQLVGLAMTFTFLILWGLWF